MKFIRFVFCHILVFVLSAQAIGQTKVNFDFSTSKFDKELSYLEILQIEGFAFYNNQQIDFITMSVSGISEKDEKQIKEKSAELNEIQKEIKEITSLKDQLILLKGEKDINKLKATIKPNQRFEDLYKDLQAYEINKTDGLFDKLQTEIVSQVEVFSKSILDKNNQVDKLNASIVELKEKATDIINCSPSYWMNSGVNNKFSFTLGKKLTPGKNYKFEFKIYSKSKQAYPIQLFSENLLKELTASGSLTSSQIAPLIEQRLTVLEDSLFSNALSLDNSTNQLVKYSNKSLMQANLKKIKQALIKYTNDTFNYIESQGFLTTIKNSINDYCIQQGVNPDLINKYLKEPTEINLKFITNLSGKEDSFSVKINRFHSEHQIILAEIKKYKDFFPQDRKNLVEVFATFKVAYLASGIINITNTASTSEDVEIDQLRIGTTYGIGIIPFKRSPEVFQFVGLNFRLDDFDMRIKENSKRYASGWSRISFKFGLALTDNMEYNGQDLKNLNVGFKPLVGFNFELIKYVNFGVGFVGFKKDSVITSGYSRNYWMPYFSIAWDFNIVNYLINIK